MTAGPALRARGLSHGYGDAFALAVDRLDVAPGEALGLVGPTGAGKSTLLRLLSAVERPDSGTITLGPDRIDGPAAPLEARRRVAMAFQRPMMFAGSVRSNVAYAPGLRGRRDPRAVRDRLDRMGLAGLADRPAGALSGGQQQLVALARAMAAGPDVLLLDEPTAHLDPSAVARVEAEVAEERRGRGIAVVWATHNLFQARRVADRVALMLEGRIVEVAPVAQFFDAPADPRTAAFVRGEMIY